MFRNQFIQTHARERSYLFYFVMFRLRIREIRCIIRTAKFEMIIKNEPELYITL